MIRIATVIVRPLLACVIFGLLYSTVELYLSVYFPTVLSRITIAGLLAAALVKVTKDAYDIGEKIEASRHQRTLTKRVAQGHFHPETIRAATHFYVRPDYMNLDPSAESELRRAPVTARSDLFEAMDRFISAREVEPKYQLILADSGLGKTSFLLNYFAAEDRWKHYKIHLIYLGADDVDARIAAIPNQEDSTLFLDAFDEGCGAGVDYKRRLIQLMTLCRNFRRVVMTCRTQFFATDDEIPRETGVVKIGPLAAGDGGFFSLWKLYLAPFNDHQVDEYLRRFYPFTRIMQRKRAHKVVRMVPDLSVRPMLLAHIPDLLHSDVVVSNSYQVYEAMVKAWLSREQRWVKPTTLRDFSLAFARETHERQTERLPRAELGQLLSERGLSISHWEATSRSLLNRDGDGNLKFSHRSIAEYLLVVDLWRCTRPFESLVMTDQMCIFLAEMLSVIAERHISLRSLYRDFEQVVAIASESSAHQDVLAVARPYDLRSILRRLLLGELTSIALKSSIPRDLIPETVVSVARLQSWQADRKELERAIEQDLARWSTTYGLRGTIGEYLAAIKVLNTRLASEGESWKRRTSVGYINCWEYLALYLRFLGSDTWTVLEGMTAAEAVLVPMGDNAVGVVIPGQSLENHLFRQARQRA